MRFYAGEDFPVGVLDFECEEAEAIDTANAKLGKAWEIMSKALQEADIGVALGNRYDEDLHVYHESGEQIHGPD